MRILTRVALLSLGLTLGACGDEEPAPTVDKSIGWQVCRLNEGGSCEASLQAHTQSVDPKKPFQVSCGESSGLWEITIRDPGREPLEAVENMVMARTPSTLSVRNINPQAGTCNVEVRETPTGAPSDISYIASCGNGCELNIQPANQGWDFVGTLSCDGLRPEGNPTNEPYSLYKTGFSEEPILLAVGNCN